MTEPSETAAVEKKPFALPRLLLGLLRPREQWRLGSVFVAVMATALFETLGVASVQPFMSIVVDPAAVDRYPSLRTAAAAVGVESWRGIVVFAAVGTAVIITLGNAAGASSLWLQARLAARARLHLASRLLQAYLRQPYVFHTTRDTASMLKIVEQDVDNVVENMVSPLLNAASRTLVVIALVVLLARQSPIVAALALVTLGGAYALVYRVVRRRQDESGDRASKAAEAWQRGAYEALGGVKDVVVLDRERAVSRRFADAYRLYVEADASNRITAAMPRYLLESLAFICMIVLGTVLLLRAGAGAASAIPALTLYLFAGYRLMPAAQQLFSEAATLRYGAPSLRTICAEWEKIGAGASTEPPQPGPMPFAHCITLDTVSFEYPGAARRAIENVSLEVRRGERVGIVGRTGAGKSTLADILLGLLEPVAGTVAIDGRALTTETTRAWRQRIGYVPQHIFLLNATVAQNIAFGLLPDEVDPGAVRDAARLAQLAPFIDALPHGYDTIVGERGIRLSGGERQRIGIARALYRRPNVLVLDEATSALDGLTEDAVLDAIRGLGDERTVILIAHRRRTLEACDRLALLENGRLVATGSMADLARTSDEFARFTTMS